MGRDEAVPAREHPRATTSTPVSVASPPAPRQADIPTVTVPWRGSRTLRFDYA
jgi:hypothetical protein